MRAPAGPALPRTHVRFVGEAVAFVVAETASAAKDAAEAVACEIDPLPVVTSPGAAAAAGAPQLHPEAPGNLAVDYHYGDTAAVSAALARAPPVIPPDIVSNRIFVNAMEPRVALGCYDAGTDRWTLHVGC